MQFALYFPKLKIADFRNVSVAENNSYENVYVWQNSKYFYERPILEILVNEISSKMNAEWYKRF